MAAKTWLQHVFLLTFRSTGPWGLARRCPAEGRSIRRASPFRTVRKACQISWIRPNPYQGACPLTPNPPPGGYRHAGLIDPKSVPKTAYKSHPRK